MCIHTTNGWVQQSVGWGGGEMTYYGGFTTPVPPQRGDPSLQNKGEPRRRVGLQLRGQGEVKNDPYPRIRCFREPQAVCGGKGVALRSESGTAERGGVECAPESDAVVRMGGRVEVGDGGAAADAVVDCAPVGGVEGGEDGVHRVVAGRERGRRRGMAMG